MYSRLSFFRKSNVCNAQRETRQKTVGHVLVIGCTKQNKKKKEHTEGFLETCCIPDRRETKKHKCISPEGTPVRLQIIVNFHRKTSDSKMNFQRCVGYSCEGTPFAYDEYYEWFGVVYFQHGGKARMRLPCSAGSCSKPGGGCREAAPSTTLGTGSNYRLNHFITNFTFFPVRQELQTCRLNIIKARLQIKLALFWGLDGEYWVQVACGCVCLCLCVSPSVFYLLRIRV